MTCAIREGAETKIWKRLDYLKHLKRRRQRYKEKPSLKIGVLGRNRNRFKYCILVNEKTKQEFVVKYYFMPEYILFGTQVAWQRDSKQKFWRERRW